VKTTKRMASAHTCDPSTSSGLRVCQPLRAALPLGSSGHQRSSATPFVELQQSYQGRNQAITTRTTCEIQMPNHRDCNCRTTTRFKMRLHAFKRTCDPSTSSGLRVCQPLSAALPLGSSGHQGSSAAPHLNINRLSGRDQTKLHELHARYRCLIIDIAAAEQPQISQGVCMRTCDPSTSSGLRVCHPLSAALPLGSSGHQRSSANATSEYQQVGGQGPSHTTHSEILNRY
jgi:hypothetical protein